jgi:hypothetical protein
MFDGRMDGMTYIGYVSSFVMYELNSHADQFDFQKFYLWPNKEAYCIFFFLKSGESRFCIG